MILVTIIGILIFCILSVFYLPAISKINLKPFILFFSSIVLLLSSLLFFNFDNNSPFFQYVVGFNIGIESLNLTFQFGLDGISIYFFFLSNLLIYLCILFIWNDNLFKQYIINLLLIQLFLLIVFSVLELFLFYVFFEAILIPMYLIIGIWGSRERKIRALYLFFYYTLCGSILMLIGLLYIYTKIGTLNLELIMGESFSEKEQFFLWIAFFLSFSSKIPMFPFHIWLPEAHVEAPTVGSVLLAGILLKLGVYGFLRFSLTLFPAASLYFSPIVILFSTFGVIYGSLNAIRQTDLKRIIAYSSIAHMNLITLGLFSFNIIGFEGSIIQSISHGFVSGGMFLLIGILYDRYHSRSLYYYGGLVHFMPLYTTILLIFTLANIALPGTSSFVGEFLLFLGIYNFSFLTTLVSATSVVLGGVYSLWLYNKISFGNLKLNYTKNFYDLKIREFVLLTPLFIFIFILGLYSNYFSFFFNFFVFNLNYILL